LSRPFRTPAGIRECLIALRAHRSGRYAEQALHQMRIGMRSAAQSGDIRAANVADIALRCSSSRNRGVDYPATLLALRGHSRPVGVEAGFQAGTERHPFTVFCNVVSARRGKLRNCVGVTHCLCVHGKNCDQHKPQRADERRHLVHVGPSLAALRHARRPARTTFSGHTLI